MKLSLVVWLLSVAFLLPEGDAVKCIKCRSPEQEVCETAKETEECEGDCYSWSSYARHMPLYQKGCADHSTEETENGCEQLKDKVNYLDGPFECDLCTEDKCNAGEMRTAMED